MFTLARKTVVRAIGAVVGTFVVATGAVAGASHMIGSPVSVAEAAGIVLFVTTVVDVTGLALLSLLLRRV